MLKTFLIRTEILYIEDITWGETTFISKCKIKTNFLEYYKVVSALKLFRQKCSQQPNGGPKPKAFGQTLLNRLSIKRPPPLLKAGENACLRKI